MSVDDAIRAAGAQLLQSWKKGGTVQMPENDLHPDGNAMQFRVKLLEDRVTGLEETIARMQRNVGNR